MERRDFMLNGAALVVAAVCPGVADIVSANPVWPHGSLEGERAYLLPGLFGVFGDDDRLASSIEVQRGNLLVAAWRSEFPHWGADSKALGFCITAKALQDRSRCSWFAPTLTALRDRVLQNCGLPPLEPLDTRQGTV